METPLCAASILSARWMPESTRTGCVVNLFIDVMDQYYT